MRSDDAHTTVMIIAGEASGDMHAAALVRKIHQERPEIRFFGIGGDQMDRAGVEIVRHIREMSILGFAEVIKQYIPIRKIFREMVCVMHRRRPCLVILVDYPGFNIRFAHRVRVCKIPLVYYISPQVWVWGKGRIKDIARTVDRMLVLFPFEEPIYREAGVDVQFVGHPLKDAVHTEMSKAAFFEALGFKTDRPTIGLLPGSRSQEVRRLLPEMMKSLSHLEDRLGPLQVVLGKASSLEDVEYHAFRESDTTRTLRNQTYDIMAHSDIIIVASGTATLEIALLGTPMVIVYRISLLSFLIAKILVKLPYVGLVNIVAEDHIVPELLQSDCNPEQIAESVYALLTDDDRNQQMRQALKTVAEKMGEAGATRKAAEEVLKFIESKRETG